MTKRLGRAHPHPPGPCSGWCPDAVAHALADKMNEAGFLKASGLYRAQVDVEIGKASARGARWWSRRLIRLYEDARLVRLDK